MRVRMPKLLANLASQIIVSASTASKPIITAPLTNTAQELSLNYTSQELQMPSISTPRNALEKNFTKKLVNQERSPNTTN